MRQIHLNLKPVGNLPAPQSVGPGSILGPFFVAAARLLKGVQTTAIVLPVETELSGEFQAALKAALLLEVLFQKRDMIPLTQFPPEDIDTGGIFMR